MEQYVSKAALVTEIEKRIADNKKEIERASHKNLEDYFEGYEDALTLFKEQFLNTLEVKEIPETTQTECKKIKKLCEIKRYDENGKEYSIMLPDTRLFINKINDIIEAIEDLDSRLQTTEALNIDYGKYKTEILEKVRKVSCLIANKANVNFKRVDERLRKIEQRIGE